MICPCLRAAGSGFAWSQAPASRTVRLITNVEGFATPNKDTCMVRSNFLITEFWDNETRLLSGWCGHRIVRDQWRQMCRYTYWPGR